MNNLGHILLSIASIIILVNADYQPQMMLTVTADSLNKGITKHLGKNISDAINNYNIVVPVQHQKIAGVSITINLTDVKQKVDINWKGNILTVKDRHKMMINSKNINITLKGHLQYKAGVTRKQKGQLNISITELEVDILLAITAPKCSDGVGFGVQIISVFVNMTKLVIKIQGKAFDNAVIKQLQNILLPRLPSIIDKQLKQSINPLLQTLSCNAVDEQAQIGQQVYNIKLNTTQPPEFDQTLRYIKAPLDIIFHNLRTSQSNYDLDRNQIPDDTRFQNTTDASLSLSSNLLDSIIWLVQDSKVLNIDVNNGMLPEDPPILLNTTNLSILMPKLKSEWPNKQVFLRITTANKFQHLLVKNGRIISVLSLSIKFVVNITGRIQNGTECLQKNQCVVACDLNMTLPLSVALKLDNLKAYGLLHYASFYQIQKIYSKIDINLISLKSIINAIVGSMLPDVNEQLSNGMPLPDGIIEKLGNLGVTDIKLKIFQDFMSLGLILDL